jgi:hypothetical protein
LILFLSSAYLLNLPEDQKMLFGWAVLLQLVWILLALAEHHIDHAAIQAQERELARKWGRPVSLKIPIC